MPKLEPLEIHHTKISRHRARAGYSYPTIRLPRTFSMLAGLPTHIYQTVHEGALAFLVVVSPKGSASKKGNKLKQCSRLAARLLHKRLTLNAYLLRPRGGL
jgi:hypothetical protein